MKTKSLAEHVYLIKLTAEECVGIVNLLTDARNKVGIISAMKELDKFAEKFRNPGNLYDL